MIIALLLLTSSFIFSQSSEDCLDCHSDKDLSIKKSKIISLYVDKSILEKSIHPILECIDCHIDFDPENILTKKV